MIKSILEIYQIGSVLVNGPSHPSCSDKQPRENSITFGQACNNSMLNPWCDYNWKFNATSRIIALVYQKSSC